MKVYVVFFWCHNDESCLVSYYKGVKLTKDEALELVPNGCVVMCDEDFDGDTPKMWRDDGTVTKYEIKAVCV